MSEMAIEAVTRWGMAGLALAASGYIIWNTHKEESKTKRRYEEKLLELSSEGNTRDTIAELDHSAKESIIKIDKKLDNLFNSQNSCQNKLDGIEQKVNELDSTVSGIMNTIHHDTAQRYANIIQVAPTLNTICSNAMDDMNVDHIFIALLHNGQNGITGIPFLKQTVIVEKYDPIKNFNDISYIHTFKDDELTKHDKLPMAILLDDLVDIVVSDDGTSKMGDLDITSAREMAKIGTKRIVFKAIKDGRNIPMGYVCAYSYTTRDIDLDIFKETATTIEQVYRDVCG